MRASFSVTKEANQCLLLVTILFFSSLTHAAQIVVLDLETTSDLSPEVQTELQEILLQELASSQDVKVVSANDLRALVEHSPQLAAPSEVAAEELEKLAVAIGSEFVLLSQAGKLGDEWVISLSLHDAKANQIFRRSTEVRVGSESATKEAMMSATHNLLREGIPENLLGPQSMSILGFQAVTLGLAKSMESSLEGAQEYRRKIILDIIQTELDYDALPKIDLLHKISISELAKLKTEALMAETPTRFELSLDSQQVWSAMRGDLERVREIRSRARDLGIVPSARPLRFETPAPVVWPTSARAAAYRDTVSPLIGEIETMLSALNSQQEETFLSFWSPEHRHAAFRRLQSSVTESGSELSGGPEFKVVPLDNLSPQMLEMAINAYLRGELLVYLCELHNGIPRAQNSIFLIRSDKRWLIRHW